MTTADEPKAANARDAELRRQLARALKDVRDGKAKIIVGPTIPRLPPKPTGG